MSTPISPDSEVSAPVAGAKSNVEISVAIRNPKTGRWRTPALEDEAKKGVQSAIETIRQMGAAAGLHKLNEEGVVLKVTEEGIFVEEERAWKNLLSDPGVDKKIRKQVEKTLKSVASVVGELSAAQAKFVEIEVRIVAAKDVFTQHVDLQKEVHGNIDRLHPLADTLSSQVFTKAEISTISLQLREMEQASSSLLRVMDQVQRLLNDGKSAEAAIDYTSGIVEPYGRYCDAMRGWQRIQKWITGRLGNDHAFQLDIEHPLLFETVAKGLISMGAKTDPMILSSASKDLEKITQLRTSYHNYLQLEQSVADRTDGLLNQEWKFNQQVGEAIKEFDGPAFLGLAKDEGWDYFKELVPYKEKLMQLKKESDAVLAILEKTTENLSLMGIQGALDYYSEQMSTRHKSYSEACAQLVPFQSLARGRSIGALLTPFKLNLLHPLEHDAYLGWIRKETSEANVIDGNFHKVIDDTQWSRFLRPMVANGVALRESHEYLDIMRFANQTRERNLAYTSRIGEFVKAYRENRELFEFVMRNHGISDLESSFIFNAYETASQALKDWDMGFQVVVDLMNLKQYQEGAAKYIELVQGQFPQLIAKLSAMNLALAKLKKPEVRSAFIAFGAKVGIKDPEQLFANLYLEPFIGKPGLDFEAFIGIATTDKIPLSKEGLKQARQTVTNELDRVDREFNQLSTLFKQDIRLLQFFNFRDLQLDPAHSKEWKEILNKYGWSFEVIEKFTLLGNRYAQLLQPLKEAELAINSETNPQKKRALIAQRKELARNIMPEVEKLHNEMIRLGGFEKLKTIGQAATDIGVLKTDLAEDIKAEADLLFNLMKARTAYFDKLFADLGFYSTWEFGSVKRILSGGAYAGWHQGDIIGLSDWYDSYIRETTPLLQAKADLDSDRANPLLQEALKKVYERQISKINRLTRQFKELGGMVKLRALEGISTLHIADVIEAKDKVVDEASSVARNPMSWDEKYLKPLLTLNLPGVTQADVKGVVKLHRDYVEALRHLVKLERKLEAHPEEKRLRTAFTEELVAKQKKLEELKKQYDDRLPTIQVLQAALNAANNPLNVEQAFVDIRAAVADTYGRFARRV